MRFGGAALGVWIAVAPAALAQDASDAPQVLSYVDEASLASPRAAAMGGALVTSADDLDAAFHNPAGIGGLDWGSQKPPFMRKVYFPWVAIGANADSSTLYREFRQEQGASDSAVGQAILDAHGGKRQYARIGLMPGVVFGRAMLIPINDMQIAATGRGSDGLIDLRYRTVSGLGFGFSGQDSEERLSLGYFGQSVTRSETVGTFTYQDIIDKNARKAAINDNTVKYTGLAHNVGLRWRMAQKSKANPTLGLMLNDVGNTVYAAQGDAENMTIKQDLAIGFALAPAFAKGRHHLMVALQANRLLDDEVSFAKKYRIGAELALGGFGSYATFALRAGYNDAGASGGLMLNLGLVALEMASHSVDIGAGNEKVVEQRFIGSMAVNVAEF